MSLKKTIQEDLKTVLQERNEIAVSTLRMLLASIGNKEIEKRTKFSKENPNAKEADLQKNSELSDEELLQIAAGEAKKYRESIEAFQKGSRQDLVDKETKELEILQKYLPAQLSEEEVKKLAQEAVASTGAKNPQDMGKVMSALMPKVKGKADGALISKIVKEFLS